MNDYNVVSLNRVVLELGQSEVQRGHDVFSHSLTGLIAHYLCGALSVVPEESPDTYRAVFDSVQHLILHGAISDDYSVLEERVAIGLNPSRESQDLTTRLRVCEWDFVSHRLDGFISAVKAFIG